MKIREVIQEFVPCEVCGNRDINQFYFHVFIHKGSQPFVKCCECEEEFYSTKARKILTRVEDAFKSRDFQLDELPHPLLKALSNL